MANFSRRDLALVANALVGTPYIWWAKGDIVGFVDPVDLKAKWKPTQHLAFDCSGFGAWVLKACGARDLRHVLNTKTIWRDWKPVPGKAQLKVFDAVLYGYPEPSHVMFYVGDGKVIGATGGDHTTLQPTLGKCVTVRQLDYRSPLGFRSVSDFVSDP